MRLFCGLSLTHPSLSSILHSPHSSHLFAILVKEKWEKACNSRQNFVSLQASKLRLASFTQVKLFWRSFVGEC